MGRLLAVSESRTGHRSSLRERKKQITRKMLVDAAVEMCLKQGYDNTTVEQIAAAADISTRTFSRYFATKDAVFIAVADDFDREIAAELEQLPNGYTPLEALRVAHIRVYERVSKRTVEGLTADKFALMLRVINSSNVLRQAAIDRRSQEILDVLAQKMGVTPDDPGLELAVALFNTTLVKACHDLVDDGPDVKLGPQLALERMNRSLEHLASYAADMKVGGRS